MTSELFTALVPMKAHSERVSNKNMRHLGGIPLYHHIMNRLVDCEMIDRIIVNTDSNDIKQNLKKYFPLVHIHERPEWLYGDDIPVNAIISYDLQYAPGEFFLQTHSTSPLVQSNTIDTAIRSFLGSDEYDSLFSVTRHQVRYFNSQGKPINHSPTELLRTQDLDPVYEENSAFYIFSRNSFQRASHRIGQTPIMFSISALEGLDIDDEQDFSIAEALVKHLSHSQEAVR